MAKGTKEEGEAGGAASSSRDDGANGSKKKAPFFMFGMQHDISISIRVAPRLGAPLLSLTAEEAAIVLSSVEVVEMTCHTRIPPLT